MAAKRFTGLTQHRNKEGILEYKKNDGLKKTWKPFSFRVSASTYLLRFKSTDLSKPDEQLLLANVIEVLPSASKGARFPFEVVFRGKGSPWKLNASSNEERISWMEAILPGSSISVTRFQKAMEANSPPPHTPGYHYESPPPYITDDSPHTRTLPGNISPVTNFQDHADPNTYTTTPKREVLPRENSEGDDDDFLSASLGPSTSAQEYLLPAKSQSLRVHSRDRPNIHVPPKRGMSAREVTKPKPSPRPRNRAPHLSPQNGHETTPTADEPSYVTMMPSPVRKKASAKKNLSEADLPNYLEVVGSEEEPMVDENNYVLADPPESPSWSTLPKHGPSVSDSIKSTGSGYSQGAEAGDGASNLVNTISRHFNPDQIGLLIQMLQEVRVDKRQTDEEVQDAWRVRSPPTSGPTSPDAYSEQDSITLRGNLKRALSYAPPLTERILVTEEDSEDSYEARPQWAKAVHTDLPLSTPGQLDTLTDLQHEALYLSKSNITDLKLIGQGQFGKVYKGAFKRGLESVPVAIKMTKKTISDYLQQSFLKEMSIMSQMMHPNIVRMYGLVNEGVESPWIVLEYMEHGDLKSFLSKNERPIDKLIKYMVDVAMGMHYISERGLVHRDLAARNVLVGTNEICKVADFGLLREIPRDDSIYQSTHSVPCPIRWMPPESISDRKFSAASDVWSFGVLVWEMFNPTKLPYEKFDNLACATKVNEGWRMPIPRGTPSIVAKIMKACWHKNPNKRPSFLLIATLLSTRTTI